MLKALWPHRLSWGLLYAALVTAMSFLMAIIATYTALFPNSDFLVVFFLIFLYGISSVSREETGRRFIESNGLQTVSPGFYVYFSDFCTFKIPKYNKVILWIFF